MVNKEGEVVVRERVGEATGREVGTSGEGERPLREAGEVERDENLLRVMRGN